MNRLRNGLTAVLLALGLLLATAVSATGQPLAPPNAVYHGNVTSRIYHRQSCRFYHCKACTAVLKSREEAAAAGYRPCKICKP
ncbi:hypothetical protein NNJEOMEG_01261 [Fundidesulfovibrio magnetotacticus]|uniref:Ada DNA repair metal-binding domain-containing protein n=1 Tax=Fundidesulfovibrio magnetotacticus TaxID=2730080 RepID=A0A6V8LTL1_9BACT|nr:Ada metal-binding domain-containing protein [Fundidesulfovibrio magnetotacticus]GFK93429.1 hypothetical protein NNJEOMEG_01261 [Fundidesulfovibrio magnetotacticus]